AANGAGVSFWIAFSSLVSLLGYAGDDDPALGIHVLLHHGHDLVRVDHLDGLAMPEASLDASDLIGDGFVVTHEAGALRVRVQALEEIELQLVLGSLELQ